MQMTFSNLRCRLLFMVFLAVIPAFILILYSGWHQRTLSIERVEERTLNHANNAAELIEQLFESVRETFISFPEDVAAREGLIRFRPDLKRIVESLPQYTSIGILDPRGDLLASSRQGIRRVNFADRPWFRQVLRTKRFTVSGLEIGRVTGKKLIEAAYPTFDIRGKIHHILFLGLDLDWLTKQLSSFSIPEQSSLLVIDNQGTILSRVPVEQVSPGETLLKADLAGAISNGGKGTARLRGVDGITRIYSFTPVQGTGHAVLVAVGIPEDVAFVDVRRALVRNILLLLISTAFVSAIAWFGSAYVVTRRIDALTQATERMAEGDRAARVPVQGRDEIARLGASFNAMAAALDLQTRRREQIEAELRESEERLRTIIDSMQDAISLIDVKDFTIVQANRVFLAEYGLAGQGEVAGRHCFDITHKRRSVCEAPDDICPVARTVGTGDHFSVEHVHYGNRGERIFVEVSTSPIKDEKGAVAQVVHVQRDITERKRAEAERERLIAELKRSNRELEQFAYVASHDLQEPLRMVSSYTALLKKKYHGRLDEKADRFIFFAMDGALRMQKLIEGLLAYSRISRLGGEFRQVDLNAVFSAAVANLAVSIAESRAIVASRNLPTVSGDETQLVQLFQNLIANAVKYRSREAAPRVNVSAKREGGNFVCSVEDNGIGIEPAYFERIFRIFQRLHTRDEYSGTGIGLALCKRIVERHQGRIWVESFPGRGSTFLFTIPSSRMNEDLRKGTRVPVKR